MQRSRLQFLVTCEHGGNRVPAAYTSLYTAGDPALSSHRGFDVGALDFARTLARDLSAPLFFSTISRLVVDLNRSEHHPRVLGKKLRGLNAPARDRLFKAYYRPYRDQVHQEIAQLLSTGAHVMHISVHSFTPVWDGRVRQADIGLLYDPRRAGEHAGCEQVKFSLQESLPGCRIRRNYPYRGTSDGLTTWLRKNFPDPAYRGVELELNQSALGGSGRFPRAWSVAVAGVLRKCREVYTP